MSAHYTWRPVVTMPPPEDCSLGLGMRDALANRFRNGDNGDEEIRGIYLNVSDADWLRGIRDSHRLDSEIRDAAVALLAAVTANELIEIVVTR